MQAGPASLERAKVDNFGFAILETPYVENAGRASSCAGSSFGNFTFHCAFAFLLPLKTGWTLGVIIVGHVGPWMLSNQNESNY